jgi:hypothetical protein
VEFFNLGIQLINTAMVLDNVSRPRAALLPRELGLHNGLYLRFIAFVAVACAFKLVLFTGVDYGDARMA